MGRFPPLPALRIVAPFLPSAGAAACLVPWQVEGGVLEPFPLAPPDVAATGAPMFGEIAPEASGLAFELAFSFADHAKEFMFVTPLGGVCTGDYDGDGLPDIYLTRPSGGNRLFRNLGGFRFEDTTAAAGVEDPGFWGTGAAFADVDNDGDLDLFACGYGRPNKCFINDGDGRFTDRAAGLGLAFDGASMMMSFADVDGDGDLDGYLATTAKAPPPGTRFEATEVDGKPVVPDHLREYWGFHHLPDGTVRRTEAGQFDRLYRNDGDAFTDVTGEAGIDGPYFTLSATWWDQDADGRPDLYVSNDFTGPDFLYRNDGAGRFRDVARDVLPHTPWFSMGSDCADVNNDGRVDLLATDMAATSHYREKVMMGNMDDLGWFLELPEPRQYMRNALYLNTGTGRVLEGAFLGGVAGTNWTWTPRLEDFDCDGWVDLFVTNGILRDSMHADISAFAAKSFRPGSREWAAFWASRPLHKEQNLAFRNTGDLGFQNVSARWGLHHHGVSFGAATADFDGDGDLDLVVNNADRPASLYHNRAGGNRVAVELRGRAGGGGSNGRGLGAHVRIKSASGAQVRYLTSAHGWLSASDAAAHFGLGDDAAVDELSVEWPSGHVQRFTDLEANTRYVVAEPEGVADERPAAEPVPALFAATGALAPLVHREDPFDDFARQPLLPNKLSQPGPAMAWGDFDADGDQDCFLGGSAGYPGRIFLNSGGRFAAVDQPAFDARLASEDTAAVFFDADGDGALDLYVASGSVEHEPGHEAYRDQLYLNAGVGEFGQAPDGSLPPDLRESAGAVAVADFDADGDLDLFVGGRSVPGVYPDVPRSALLRNDGTGRFEDVAPESLARTGMVTGAVWADADADGLLDLFVSQEWGPVQQFRNAGGELVAVDAPGLAGRTGWWNGIAAGDLNGDGAVDLVATNYGLNTKYSASERSPALLFYGDFDGSGSAHLVEAKSTGTALYPRRGLSCSSAAMPFIREKLGTFHAFATAALEEIYPLERGTKLEANTLESGVFYGDGRGGFSFQPLPRLAQIAPAFGVALADLDGDGDLDCAMAQNSFAPQRETGRMDGGLGLVLLNDGTGSLEPLWPDDSGVVVPGAAATVAAVDFDGDSRTDLVFGVNGVPVAAFAAAPAGGKRRMTGGGPSATAPREAGLISRRHHGSSSSNHPTPN